ncbi:MAG: lipopolysaccharide biosynthesis protein [Bacteroidetes bacterium]|nr:lipopolysaccharide biosynthesis protein [Bacteroidota bacterium]
MKRDILIYFSGKIIPALVNLAIIVLGIRFLGGEEYGRYSLIFYATMLVSTLTFGWIQHSILRFLSSYKTDTKNALNHFFHLMLASSGTGVIIMLLLGHFYFHLPPYSLLIVLFYTFMYNVLLFRLTVWQAAMKPVKYAVFEGIYNFILLLVLLLLIYAFAIHKFTIIFMAMSAGLVFAEIGRWLFINGEEERLDYFTFFFDREFTKKAMGYGLSITLWLLLSYLMNIADRYIIKEYDTYAAVGTYSAIKDLFFKISSFSTIAILLSYNPKVMDSWNNGRKREAGKYIREALMLEGVVFGVVFILFLATKDFLYTKVLHLEQGDLLLVSLSLIGSAFLWQIALFVNKPLELLFKQRYMIFAILFCMLLNIGLNLIFVPQYGIKAASVISFISSLLYVILVFGLSLFFISKRKDP